MRGRGFRVHQWCDEEKIYNGATVVDDSERQMSGLPLDFKGQTVARATLGSLLSGLCGQGALIISGVLAARILGVEDRGYLALLAAFPLVLSQLGGLGVPQAVTYQLIRNPHYVRHLLRMTYRVFGVQALVLVLRHTSEYCGSISTINPGLSG